LICPSQTKYDVNGNAFSYSCVGASTIQPAAITSGAATAGSLLTANGSGGTSFQPPSANGTYNFSGNFAVTGGTNVDLSPSVVNQITNSAQLGAGSAVTFGAVTLGGWFIDNNNYSVAGQTKVNGYSFQNGILFDTNSLPIYNTSTRTLYGNLNANGGGLTNVPLTALQNNTNNTLVIINGNVGIGTTNPATALQVVGTVTASGNVNFSGTANGWTIQSSGSPADSGPRMLSGNVALTFQTSYGVYVSDTGGHGIFLASGSGVSTFAGTVTARGYSSLATNNTASTPTTYTMTSGGFTNLNTKIVRVLGYSGTSVVFTNFTSGYGCAVGTIAAGTGYFELQTNECLKGTAMAATGIVDK
jgi:hypothetical protein